MNAAARQDSSSWRGRRWPYALIALIVLAYFLMPERSPTARSIPAANMAEMIADAPLSVMTFNVEGLPPPARFGRGDALGQIGSRLAQLRADRRQPRIVLLQEAFSGDARKIAKKAGYAYVADGPARGERSAITPTSADLRYNAAANRWRGEGGTKLLGSGLQILSDYPVLSVKRMAFPDFACAGLDCLANKGVVLAFVAVPGATTPVAVAVTHLNSIDSAKVDYHRTLFAYRRQVDLLERFLIANVPPGTPLIAGGDYNVGEDGARRAYLEASVARWPRAQGSATIDDALHLCARNEACGSRMADEARGTMKRIKDMQLLAQGRDDALVPVDSAVPFGREADGSALSDHVGYTVYYRWPTRAAPHALR